MSTLNKHMIIGRVGRDPEVREFKNGSRVISFPCATNESYKNKEGEYIEKTEWHDVKCFNPSFIDAIIKKVRKGDLIYLEGKIETDVYVNKDGVDVKRKITIMDNFQKMYVKMVKDEPQFSDKTEKYPEPIVPKSKQNFVDDEEELPF